MLEDWEERVPSMQDTYSFQEKSTVRFIKLHIKSYSLMHCVYQSKFMFIFFCVHSQDTNFDELIKSIYGDVGKLEKYEEDEIKKLNKKNMNNAYAESRKMGMMNQALQRVR